MPRPTSPIPNAQAHNALVALLATLKLANKLPPERRIAEVAGTSRTTVRRILGTLEGIGLLRRGDQGNLVLARAPKAKDRLPETDSFSRRENVERSLVDMLIKGRLKPGTYFSELALARQHRVTTGTVREALLGLSHLGVFSKQARKRWRVVEINREMIHELMDLRILIELFALGRYMNRPDPVLKQAFHEIHRDLKAMVRSPRLERSAFLRLDGRLHQTILKGAGNRYLLEYSRHIFFPIELQFLHHGFEEKTLRLGISQHLAILEAIAGGHAKAAIRQLDHHLQSARQTLLDLQEALSMEK